MTVPHPDQRAGHDGHRAALRFGVLGPVVVWDLHEREHVASGNTAKLLGLLIAQAPRPIASDDLADHLWSGNGSPTPSRASLHVAVSRSRGWLDSKGMGGRIETTNGGYRLVAGTEEVDAFLFEDLVESAVGLSGEDRLDVATRALAMWRGTPFDGQAARHPALLAITERLDQGRLHALEIRQETRVELGAHREAIPELRSLVIEFPYHEPFWRLLMISLCRSGRQADAVALYDRYRNTLVEGPGLEPSRALMDLLRSVLRREIDL